MKVSSTEAQKTPPAVPTTAARQAAGKSGAAPVAAPPQAPPAEPEDKKAAKARAKQEKAEAKARAKEEKAAQKAGKKAAKAEKPKTASTGKSNFLVQHVEKVALGFTGLVALGLMYLSLGKMSPAEKQAPEDLHEKVDVVRDRTKEGKFWEGAFPVPVIEEHVRNAQSRLPGNSYTVSLPFDPSMVPPQKRGQVEIFPVEKAIALAGSGAIYIRQNRPPGPIIPAPQPPAGAHGGAAAPGGGNVKPLPPDFKLVGVARPEVNKLKPVPFATEGRRWAVILAKLPLARENGEYDRQLAAAFEFNPKLDQVHYVEVRMMRLEIPPGAKEDNLDWSKATVVDWSEQVRQYSAQTQTWALAAPEVIPREYRDYCHNDSERLPANYRAAGMGVLTKPLAPLVSRSWEPWAIHPDLREIIVEQAVAQAEKQAADAAREKEKKEEPEAAAPEPAAAPAPAPAAADAKPDANPFQNLDHKPADKAPEKVPPPRTARKAARKPVDPQRAVEFQVVRVFDFTVEPGKHYRYKLQLAVSNPNHTSRGLQPRNLQHPERAAEPLLFSPWSEPTNTVVIPSGDSVYAETIVRSSNDSNEKTAKVVMTLLDFDNGQESAAELTLHRGALAGGRAKQLTLDVLKNQVTLQQEAPVHTDMILADMRGGDMITAELSEPAQMLFIDSAGRMIVQDSAEDEMAVSLFQQLIKLFEPPPPVPGQGPGPGGQGGGILFGNGGGGNGSPTAPAAGGPAPGPHRPH